MAYSRELSESSDDLVQRRVKFWHSFERLFRLCLTILGICITLGVLTANTGLGRVLGAVAAGASSVFVVGLVHMAFQHEIDEWEAEWALRCRRLVNDR